MVNFIIRWFKRHHLSAIIHNTEKLIAEKRYSEAAIKAFNGLKRFPESHELKSLYTQADNAYFYSIVSKSFTMDSTRDSIVYCEKCGIAYINGVFHWSYKNQPTTAEKVLARVCIPTQDSEVQKPCLAKSLYEKDLKLKEKNPEEINQFLHTHNPPVDLNLQSMEDYIKMARELL